MINSFLIDEINFIASSDFEITNPTPISIFCLIQGSLVGTFRISIPDLRLGCSSKSYWLTFDSEKSSQLYITRECYDSVQKILFFGMSAK